MQDGGFHVDGEIPALVVADGDPVESHFPTVEVAIDVQRGVGESVVGEVPAGGEGDFPLLGEAYVAAYCQGLHDLVGGDAHESGVGQVGGMSQVIVQR